MPVSHELDDLYRGAIPLKWVTEAVEAMSDLRSGCPWADNFQGYGWYVDFQGLSFQICVHISHRQGDHHRYSRLRLTSSTTVDDIREWKNSVVEDIDLRLGI